MQPVSYLQTKTTRFTLNGKNLSDYGLLFVFVYSFGDLVIIIIFFAKIAKPGCKVHTHPGYFKIRRLRALKPRLERERDFTTADHR